jgi:acetylornithine deacetylase/succinyl-diaminopimelate desuccinylase-like protein
MRWAQVLRGLFEEVRFYKEGGSIPALVLFKQQLGLDTTSFGFGLASDNLHAPNEHYQVSMWDKGREAWIRLLQELAEAAKPVQSEEEL